MMTMSTNQIHDELIEVDATDPAGLANFERSQVLGVQECVHPSSTNFQDACNFLWRQEQFIWMGERTIMSHTFSVNDLMVIDWSRINRSTSWQ
jgi:hypothetical protein